jgi:hypothetical protein
MASNSVVAHNWANQTGKSCNGSSFFYEGQTLYSFGYHFVVGAITEDGKTAVMNSQSYSSSTNKHQSRARSAVAHLNMVYCHDPKSAIKGHHYTNTVVWERKVNDLMQKDTTRCNLHKLVGELEKIVAQSAVYCAYFGISNPEYHTKAANFIEELTSSPKWLREQELEATKEARKAAASAKKEAENLLKFRAGEIKHFSSALQYLRLDGDKICTSLGVCIPVREFMLHYNRMIHRESLVGTKVDGSWTILSVTDESVKIGCHIISREELESTAKQINV